MSTKFEKWARKNVTKIIYEIKDEKNFKSFLLKIYKNGEKTEHSNIINLKNKNKKIKLYSDSNFFKGKQQCVYFYYCDSLNRENFITYIDREKFILLYNLINL